MFHIWPKLRVLETPMLRALSDWPGEGLRWGGVENGVWSMGVVTTLGPSRFIDGVPVLKADGPARRSRLALCRLSADTLKLGLGLLGIPSLERM